VITLTKIRIVTRLALVFRRKEISYRKIDNKTRRKREEENVPWASLCNEDRMAHATSSAVPERLTSGILGTAGMLALDTSFSLKPWSQSPKRLDPKSCREYLQGLEARDQAEVVVDFTKAWLAAVRLLFAVL